MLVCDFIKDEFGHSFFTNCKSFWLADAERITKLEYIDRELYD